MLEIRVCFILVLAAFSSVLPASAESANIPYDSVDSPAQIAAPELSGSSCIPVPNDAYDGSLTSMACGTLPNTFAGTVGTVSVGFGINHSFAGDLVLKVIEPTGQRVATVLSRPGLAEAADDGSGCCGHSGELVAGAMVRFGPFRSWTDAELLGASGQTVCQQDGICLYQANPGAAAQSLSAFEGVVLDGTGSWTLCAGDASSSGQGELCSGNWEVNPPQGAVSATIIDPVASNDCVETLVSFSLSSNGGSDGAVADILVYDDMQLKYQQSLPLPPGDWTQGVRFAYPETNTGSNAPGIGLVVQDENGTVLDSVDPLEVSVPPVCEGGVPEVVLQAFPNPVPAGLPFTLAWSATNASGFNPCVATLGSPTTWSQTQLRPASGMETYVVDQPMFVDFALSCENQAGLIGEAVLRVKVTELFENGYE